MLMIGGWIPLDAMMIGKKLLVAKMGTRIKKFFFEICSQNYFGIGDFDKFCVEGSKLD